MADPPSYEDSASEYGQTFAHQDKVDSRHSQRFSIREEVGASRSQHIAALVVKLLPHIRERARHGLSKTTLLLLPSDQGTCGFVFDEIVAIRGLMLKAPGCNMRGQLVGFSEDEAPFLIQLEGRQDSMQFWTQQSALSLLQEQMLASISDDVTPPSVTNTTLPERPSVSSKPSFFGRKGGKAADVKPLTKSKQPSVSVEVQLDEAHFRSETEFGLFETARARAVLVVVEVR